MCRPVYFGTPAEVTIGLFGLLVRDVSSSDCFLCLFSHTILSSSPAWPFSCHQGSPPLFSAFFWSFSPDIMPCAPGESLPRWVLPVSPPWPAAQTHGVPHDAKPPGETPDRLLISFYICVCVFVYVMFSLSKFFSLKVIEPRPAWVQDMWNCQMSMWPLSCIFSGDFSVDLDHRWSWCRVFHLPRLTTCRCGSTSCWEPCRKTLAAVWRTSLSACGSGPWLTGRATATNLGEWRSW